jgi:hypothetical protein
MEVLEGPLDGCHSCTNGFSGSGIGQESISTLFRSGDEFRFSAQQTLVECDPKDMTCVNEAEYRYWSFVMRT